MSMHSSGITPPSEDWTQHPLHCPHCGAASQRSVHLGDGFAQCLDCGQEWNVVDRASWGARRGVDPTDDHRADHRAEIMMSVVAAIREFVQEHPQASVADVMAEFELTHAQFSLAVQIIQTLQASEQPAAPRDGERLGVFEFRAYYDVWMYTASYAESRDCQRRAESLTAAFGVPFAVQIMPDAQHYAVTRSEHTPALRAALASIWQDDTAAHVADDLATMAAPTCPRCGHEVVTSWRPNDAAHYCHGCGWYGDTAAHVAETVDELRRDDTLAPWSECQDCGMAWDEPHLSVCYCGLRLCDDCRKQQHSECE